MVALVFVFAAGSFLQENWGADETPGAVETFLANLFLRQTRQLQDDLQNPFPPAEENLQAGRELYDQQCAFCHGQDGRGQGQTGIQFYPPVPSLADPEIEMTDAQIHFVVTKGIRYTAMPSFAKVFTSDEIWKIVLWTRHLARQPLPPQQSQEQMEGLPQRRDPSP